MIINDPFFQVHIDENSKQKNPDMAIWSAMRTCMDGGSKTLTTSNPVQAVINNGLKFGHWSILEHASVKLNFAGFPHDTVMQFRTHQKMATLVQSLRYSDELYSKCATGYIDPNQLFYFDSTGEQLIADRESTARSCRDYTDAIANGAKKESARRRLSAGYRQSFTMSGTFRQWMHVLDQRLLADTQVEAQTAAWMALDRLCEYSEFFVWYRKERAGKNRLSP
jgi:flavin-dependent thymidylate synthase